MIHTQVLEKKEEKKADNNNILWRSSVIFRSLKRRIFFVRRRRHCAAVVTVVSSLPNPSLTLSSFLPGSAAHMTSISLQHSAKNYPWLHCRRRGGGDGGGGSGADICSWKISIVTLKEKSQTPSRIYTHTHIHTHRQPRAKPYLLIASWHPTIYANVAIHCPGRIKGKYVYCLWSLMIHKYL